MPYSEYPFRVLQAQITSRLRHWLEEFLTSVGEESAVLCLIKTVDGRWIYGAYHRENIEVIEPKVRQLDQVLFYEIDKITSAIPQFQYVQELEGKEIDRGKNCLTLTELGI